MGCGAAEATGLGFVCFICINRRVLSANSVDIGFHFPVQRTNHPDPEGLIADYCEGPNVGGCKAKEIWKNTKQDLVNILKLQTKNVS